MEAECVFVRRRAWWRIKTCQKRDNADDSNGLKRIQQHTHLKIEFCFIQGWVAAKNGRHNLLSVNTWHWTQARNFVGCMPLLTRKLQGIHFTDKETNLLSMKRISVIWSLREVKYHLSDFSLKYIYNIASKFTQSNPVHEKRA